MMNEQKKYCSESIDSLLLTFGTDPKNGLPARDIPHKRAAVGFNELKKDQEEYLGDKVLRQAKNPLIIILILAGIATLLLDEIVDAIVIFAAFIINITIGVFQEERASRAFEKLNDSQEKFATVIRSGVKTRVPSRELVPGDLVVIEAGAYVPADMRLIETKNLNLNEAALTGEWVEVQKRIGQVHEDAPLTEQINMAWMGTLVTSGYGHGIVVATGNTTQVGHIASNLGREASRQTPLQASIGRVAKFLILVICVGITVIFFLGLLRGESMSAMLLIAIAIAVSAMPQGLPAAVTVVLALGMEGLLKQGGLVRSLLAAETLGATTIVLTDKTGTLTEAKMELSEKVVSLNRRASDKRAVEMDARELLRSAVMASDAFVVKRDDTDIVVEGRPIEKAIILSGLTDGLSQENLFAKEKLLDLLKFESSRRYSVSLYQTLGDERHGKMYVSGAPEVLLESANRLHENGVGREMREDDRIFFNHELSVRSSKGMRVIAVGYIETARKQIQEHFAIPSDDFVFLGLLVFVDPIRDDAKASMAEVQEAGVRVLMVTGDNAGTAGHIAEEVGIRGAAAGAITGAQIDTMSDTELYAALKKYSVIARVVPEQKLRIARVFKNNGEVVAMTGDGINDAPALRTADIGIAIGSGTEVAKEASDIVLLNNSFAIIVAAIRTGRKIVDNIKKIVAYLLSTSFSSLTIVSAAVIVGTPLPILPSQILWANIVEEGLMSFAFAFEPEEKGIMQRSPRDSSAKQILTRELTSLIVIVAVITGALLIVLYFWLLKSGLPIEEIRTIMFVSLTLDSIFFSFSLKNLNVPLWRISFFDNRFLIGALSISVLTLVAALTFKPLQSLLSLTPLTLGELGLLAVVGVINLVAIEIVKYAFFSKNRASALLPL